MNFWRPTVVHTCQLKSTTFTKSARQVDFPQINLDLIAGMVGETEAKWRDAVRKALELQPDSRDDLPDGAALQHDHLARDSQGGQGIATSQIGRRNNVG